MIEARFRSLQCKNEGEPRQGPPSLGSPYCAGPGATTIVPFVILLGRLLTTTLACFAFVVQMSRQFDWMFASMHAAICV